MKASSDVGIFQCYLCGFIQDDFSYFQVLGDEDELVCIGCYENYQSNSDIYIKDEE